MKKSLITGISGQDGSWLAELLLSKGYEVHGLVRRGSQYPDLKNLNHLKDRVCLHFGDLLNEHDICHLVNALKPDEIYNMAAQSDVRISFEVPEYTSEVTYLGYLRLLEAVKSFSPNSKVYQASSSEMFGNALPPQDENTVMVPENPYGVAKLSAYLVGRIYRRSYNLFIANGILFNHESERRGLNFVTRKITNSVARIKLGKQDKLQLGNLEAKRDWGYAPEYMQQAWLMLQQKEPDDFVVGTGEVHSVMDFVTEAFNLVDLDWEKYVYLDKAMIRPSETCYLQSNPAKAKKILGWEPKVKFRDLVKIMVDYDLKMES